MTPETHCRTDPLPHLLQSSSGASGRLRSVSRLRLGSLFWNFSECLNLPAAAINTESPTGPSVLGAGWLHWTSSVLEGTQTLPHRTDTYSALGHRPPCLYCPLQDVHCRLWNACGILPALPLIEGLTHGKGSAAMVSRHTTKGCNHILHHLEAGNWWNCKVEWLTEDSVMMPVGTPPTEEWDSDL